MLPVKEAASAKQRFDGGRISEALHDASGQQAAAGQKKESSSGATRARAGDDENAASSEAESGAASRLGHRARRSRSRREAGHSQDKTRSQATAPKVAGSERGVIDGEMAASNMGASSRDGKVSAAGSRPAFSGTAGARSDAADGVHGPTATGGAGAVGEISRPEERRLVQEERERLLAPLRKLPLEEERRLLDEERARLLAPLDVAARAVHQEAAHGTAAAAVTDARSLVRGTAAAAKREATTKVARRRGAAAGAAIGAAGGRGSNSGVASAGLAKLGDKQARSELMSYFDGLIARKVAIDTKVSGGRLAAREPAPGEGRAGGDSV